MKKLPFTREERVLSNGMKVILIHKPGYAKSLFMIGIPAGGMNIEESERIYKTGCAHFLEHQMFRLNGQDVTPVLASLQAQTNAYTSYTETCYYIATTADPLPPLKVLIDFVQTLDITGQSVNKEKGIILSEYNLYDNSPENRLLKSAFKAMYHNHPLKEDILGTPEDISDMEVEDLQAFYNTYYDPSQLVLVGITGKEPGPIFDFIEETEKAYPSKVGGKHDRVFPKEPAEPKTGRMEIEMDVQRPWALLAVKLKPEGTLEENLKKDYMLNLWLDAEFSMLNPRFQDLLNQRIITQSAGAEADLTDDHAYILMYSQTDKPEEFLQVAKDVLEKRNDLDPEVFDALRIQNIASSIRQVDDFDGMAGNLVRAEFGNYSPEIDLQIARETTLDEINDFVKSLDCSKMSEILILPKKKDENLS